MGEEKSSIMSKKKRIYISGAFGGNSHHCPVDAWPLSHDGYVNGVFLDFSTVRRIGLKELWQLKRHTRYDLNAPLPVWPEWMQDFEDY